MTKMDVGAVITLWLCIELWAAFSGMLAPLEVNSLNFTIVVEFHLVKITKLALNIIY